MNRNKGDKDMNMDVTVLGEAIGKLLKRNGAGLSEEQYLIMQGFIAGFLMQVELRGLEAALDDLAKSKQ